MACVLVADNYEDALDNTYLLEDAVVVVVVVAVAVLDPLVMVMLLIFQRLPLSSVLRVLTLGRRRVVALLPPKDLPELPTTDQLHLEEPLPVLQNLRLLLPVMTFRFPYLQFNSSQSIFVPVVLTVM